MPDFVLLILITTAFIGFEIQCISFTFERSKKIFKSMLIWLLICFGLSSWFYVGHNTKWSPYAVETKKILTYRNSDGMLNQYMEGDDTKSGFDAKKDRNGYAVSKFYPDGTTIKISHYHPWQTGIRWLNHDTYDFILPKN